MGAKCCGGLNEMTVVAGAKAGLQHSILSSIKGQWGEKDSGSISHHEFLWWKGLTKCQSSTSFRTGYELLRFLWGKKVIGLSKSSHLHWTCTVLWKHQNTFYRNFCELQALSFDKHNLTKGMFLNCVLHKTLKLETLQVRACRAFHI